MGFSPCETVISRETRAKVHATSPLVENVNSRSGLARYHSEIRSGTSKIAVNADVNFSSMQPGE